jgi:DNA repair and recombination protein RAD52
MGHYDGMPLDPVPIKEEPRAGQPRMADQKPGQSRAQPAGNMGPGHQRTAPQQANQTTARQPNPQHPAEPAQARPQMSSHGSNGPNQYNRTRQSGPGPLEAKAIQAAQAQAQARAAAATSRTGSPSNSSGNGQSTSSGQSGQPAGDAGLPPAAPGELGMPPGDMPTVGFITSRAADSLNQNGQPAPGSQNLPAFNPHAESPSIRRTSGFNHSTSAPVAKEGSGAGASYYNKTPKAQFMNPMADPTRRIGAPGASSSPLANRGSYKPPQPVAKRPAEGDGRPPLADLSNTRVEAAPPGDPVDLKRQRLSM